MTIFQAVILGLIEGVTEFLPVSSTAHLLVAERLMGNLEPSLFFNTVVQLGALGAVVVYFRTRLKELFLDSLEYLKKMRAGRQSLSPASLPTGINILAATLPVFVVGYFARDQIALFHGSMPLIGFTSVAVAILLWYGQRIAKTSPRARVGPRELITMGIYQILALVPGVSRSGIVMVGGLMQGLSFEKVLEYSFLMSIPALGGAGLFELGAALGESPSQEVLISTLVATVVAFISALLVIRSLLAFVKARGFTPFIIYRLFFGALTFFL